MHRLIHVTSDPLLMVEGNQRVGELWSWAMGRESPGGYSLLLHVCEILHNERGRQRGGRRGRSREAERRRRGGKKTVRPGKPYGFCQDVSLWLPSPTSARRAEHEYLPTFLTTRTD